MVVMIKLVCHLRRSKSNGEGLIGFSHAQVLQVYSACNLFFFSFFMKKFNVCMFVCIRASIYLYADDFVCVCG